MNKAKIENGLGEVFSLLRKIGAENDPDWLSVVLFVRNLVHHLSVFTDDQKADMQQFVLTELSAKRVTATGLPKIVRHLDKLILENSSTLELQRALSTEQQSAVALLNEINQIVQQLKQTGINSETRIEDFGRKTLDVVESDKDKSSIATQVRGMVENLVAEVREEAREWRDRAEQLEQNVNYDPLLSDLYNRRALDSYLESETLEAIKEGKPLSLMMIDVDKFKNINDRFGHQVGDKVLKGLATVVKSHSVQFKGFSGRYGGEELVVVCTSTALKEAGLHAEAIRAGVEKFVFKLDEESHAENQVIQFTVSIGVATLLPGWGASELLRAADMAMYAAKRNGRNQVELFDEKTTEKPTAAT